jgi:uncharacterized cofD-like protein
MAIHGPAFDRCHIVGIGGGTGLAVLLAGLKRHAERARRHARSPIEISAIVTVADDGGSTGRLRRELGIPGVGDLRNCLVAASQGNSLWRDLFQHRFADGDGLGGHALGNLVMAALTQSSGGLLPAIERLARPLRLCGRVFPMTEQRVTLCAELEDGEVVFGESLIPRSGRAIRRVWLSPRNVTPAPGVLDALAGADAIVIGPGSLYTSIVPNLLVDGVVDAIRKSRALRLFVCNLMTQPGETPGFDAARHLRALQEYLGPGAIDVCLMNGRALPVEAAARFADAEPVAPQPASLARAFPIVADLLPEGPFLNRHDPAKLAEIVVSLARCLRRRPSPAVADAATPWDRYQVPAISTGVD